MLLSFLTCALPSSAVFLERVAPSLDSRLGPRSFPQSGVCLWLPPNPWQSVRPARPPSLVNGIILYHGAWDKNEGVSWMPSFSSPHHLPISNSCQSYYQIYFSHPKNSPPLQWLLSKPPPVLDAQSRPLTALPISTYDPHKTFLSQQPVSSFKSINQVISPGLKASQWLPATPGMSLAPPQHHLLLLSLLTVFLVHRLSLSSLNNRSIFSSGASYLLFHLCGIHLSPNVRFLKFKSKLDYHFLREGVFSHQA